MILSRTLLSTALGLTLASCAMDSVQNSPTIQDSTAQTNHAAAASVQVASLANPAVATDAPVAQKGTVLWRRTGDEANLTPTPKVSEELNRLRNALSDIRGENSQQINALEDRLAGNQLVQAQTLASLKEEQERKEKELRAQTAEAVTTVAALAKQGMQSTESIAKTNSESWNATTQSLAQMESRLQGTASDVRESRHYTEQQIASAREVQSAQLAALSNQLATNQQLTALQIAELRQVTADNRALAQSEVTNVAAALRLYADSQFQQAQATSSASMLQLAKATDQSVAKLSDQTNRRLGLMWQAANKQAEKLAEQKANIVATSLIALQKQTEEQRLTPEQIRTISEKTVADSTPEFRALALQTMQESQDYIRTVARTAVQDNDPAMQTALANAARDVITKDDQVVFAIRKAVADELEGAVTATRGPSTRLGDRATGTPGAVGEENLDPNRLRIAQLLAPGTNSPASDAAPLSEDQLAAISPAAGVGPVDGNQRSWSTPNASLLRSRNRADWMDIRQYKVVVHEDDQTLEEMLAKVLKHAEPFTGPWQVRWKVSDENKELLTEKFSMDAETNFEDFVSYLAQYVVNDRGVKLSFNLFDNERIIVISD